MKSKPPSVMPFVKALIFGATLGVVAVGGAVFPESYGHAFSSIGVPQWIGWLLIKLMLVLSIVIAPAIPMAYLALCIENGRKRAKSRNAPPR